MTGQKLYWDAGYEIVLALMEVYPKANLDDIGLEELNQRIVRAAGLR